MRSITVKAHAKINLVLDVLYKREDNYHELDGIMHAIDLHDTVSISVNNDGLSRIDVSCNVHLPVNNTAFLVANEYISSTEIKDSVTISVEKNIPSQAGLGGASADAAAVLYGLQKLYGALDEAELYRIAEKVGADVPFCLKYINGGCARARGKGEILEELPPICLDLLIVKANWGISTKELFDSLNVASKKSSTAVENAVNAIRSKSVDMLISSIYNALEAHAANFCGEIRTIKEELLSIGAKAAFMTGSGSAVIGIFGDKQSRSQAGEFYRNKHQDYFIKAAKTI
jgi:4-diphosphocytidyl-2-C-methyl-D-erythritol kinase